MTEYLSRMSYQRAFTKVYKHLMKQNRRCYGEGGCRYQYNGMKCAIGALIPDNMYQPRFEGNGICVIAPNLTKKRSYFYSRLQQIHDGSTPEFWREGLKALAKKYNLKVPQC